MVVNFPPGGAADQLGRAVSGKLQDALGQTFVVENRPGANGSIGASEVAKSPADGHTILMSSGGAIALNGLLYKNLGYDPMKALEPVAPVASVPVFLQIKPAIPANTPEKWHLITEFFPDWQTTSLAEGLRRTVDFYR